MRNLERRGESAISLLSISVGLAFAGTIVLACVDAPTKPKAAPTLSQSAHRSAVIASRDVGVPLMDDASGRLASAVDDADARGRLRSLLTGLSSARDKGDEDRARDHIARLRKFIESRADAPDAADLAAIALALDQIESQLNSTTEPNK